MNPSALSTFKNIQAAACKQTVKRALACLLWTVAVMMLPGQTAWAANGSACLPTGFSIYNPVSPNVISAKRSLSTDQILSTKYVVDYFSSRACNSDPQAELSYMFVPNALFVDSYSVGGFQFTATANIVQNTPNYVKIGIQYRTDSPDIFSNSYTFYINHLITIYCSGGLGAYVVSTAEVRVTGVNSDACKGNYNINNKYEIYQNKDVVLKSGYKQATTGSGFRVRVSLYSGDTRTHTAMTMIPGSDTMVFQSGVACAYSLSSSSLDLGSFTDTQIWRQNIVPVAFSIKTSNCTNTTGGGGRHGLYVYWNFDAVDPNDPTIMANTSTGANASTNVGAKISCNNGSAIAEDNASVNLSSEISTVNSFPCIAYLVPMSNAAGPEDIGPGSFTSRATLTFQFD